MTAFRKLLTGARCNLTSLSPLHLLHLQAQPVDHVVVLDPRTLPLDLVRAHVRRRRTRAARSAPSLVLRIGGAEVTLDVPAADLAALLEDVAGGRTLQLSAVLAEGGTDEGTDEELTTTEAARTLGVSRPFLIKQVEAGRLPCRLVGTHRRLCRSDVEAFGVRMRQTRSALDALASEAQALGLGY